MTELTDNMMKKSVLTLVFGMICMVSQAQKLRTYTTNEKDSMECVTNLSLYIEFFKQGNYTDAVKGWRLAVKLCPRSQEGLWINGAKMYQEFVEKEKDKVKKEKFIDTLMWVYDERIKHFDKEGYVLGRKGSDLYKYRSNNPQAAYEALSKSYELQDGKLEAGVNQFYFLSAFDLYNAKELSAEQLFDIYGKCSDVTSRNMESKYKDAYLQVQDAIDTKIGTIASCEKLIEIFKPKFQAEPTNAKLISQITKLLDKQNCGDQDFYLEVAVAGYQISPTPQGAFDIGKGYYSKQKFNDALKYFKEAAQSDDKELNYNANRLAANSCLATGSYQSAKSFALKMLETHPNSGDAYILIGKSYAAGHNDCGNDECKGKAAYWAAVDKFQKAKAVDPSVADQAQQLINTYSAQFPIKSDCFFYSLNDGDSYTLDCWIGETTTVRTRPN